MDDIDEDDLDAELDELEEDLKMKGLMNVNQPQQNTNMNNPMTQNN